MSKHKPKEPELTLRYFVLACIDRQDIARRMIKEDREWLTRESGIGETALADIVVENHLSAARFLIEQGSDVNTRDHFDGTPLLNASKLGYREMVDLLILNGAEVDVMDNVDETPLRTAASHGYAEICDALLTAGADIHYAGEFATSIFEEIHTRKGAKVIEVFEKHGHKPPPTPPVGK